MKSISRAAFLAWAERAGLWLDPRYPHSAVLAFQADPHHDRFWEVPVEPERRPYFLWSILELMGEWQQCYAWRHLGRWPKSADPGRINDVVEWHILNGLDLPHGTADVVSFDRAEADKLVTLLFSTTVFGRSVSDDLYIVPDHARYIVQTDHHNVVHAYFGAVSDIDVWVQQMGERGFPLPEDLPDATFKRPHWLNGKSQG
jgi:hypothetical protein